MSDALMDQTRTNGHVAAPMPADAAQSAGGFDIVQILWRWKWLPILGSLIGASLGFLYFSQQPATYEAAALVQVVNTMPAPSNNRFYDPMEKQLTRVDESMVIRSQAVLQLAVKQGRLTEQADFLGMEANEIIASLMEEKSPLVIEPADKDDNTTLINISYVSKDADVAAKVVNAVVEGYSEYLENEFRNVGDDLKDLLENAESSLTAQFQKLYTENQELQSAYPNVVWNGDEASDPYTQNYFKLNADLAQIRVEREKLQTIYTTARAAIEAGRPAESTLLLLSSAGSGFSDQENWYDRNRMPMDDPSFEFKTNLESVRLEREVLVPLKIKLRVALDSVGEGHPSVAVLQKQVEGFERQIAIMRENERRLSTEEDRIREEAKEKNGLKILSMQERLATRMGAVAEQVQALQDQEKLLETFAGEELTKSRDLRGMIGKSRLLNEQLANIKTLQSSYGEKVKEINLMPKIGQRVLKRLNIPSVGWFYGPKIPIYLLGGGAVGFILLSGLAVLMDLADRSYRNPAEIASDLGVTVLGHIPVMDISRTKKSVEGVDASICAIHHSKGRVSEAYRTVRTGLYFNSRGKSLKVIQVTSPVPGDGKSTLSCNIAVTMAQSGRKVLLIDADLRRPRVAKIFGIDSDIGVAAVVNGQVEFDEAIQAGPVANLSILPGGKRPNNPAEILSSDRFKNMVDALREKFDVIIIDTPPLLAVSDPGAVAGIADGVVMTMRLRRNVKPLAERAKNILESVGANLLGVVINGVSSEAGYGYNYDYNDYRYAYKYGSNYRSGYGYRYGYGNYRYGYVEDQESANDLAASQSDA